ncbi:MAG: hypothetical protein M3440_10935 [Chloroflexota bacterium]|nr:hypothetical protein [Chloroflexota bacterium]
METATRGLGDIMERAVVGNVVILGKGWMVVVVARPLSASGQGSMAGSSCW